MAFRLVNVAGRAALVDDGDYHDLATLTGGDIGPDPMRSVAAHDRLHELAGTLAERAPTGRLDGAELGPPVPAPRQCFGVGLNYAEHAEETGKDVPDQPVVFTKFPGCIVGPTDDVVLGSAFTDYEAELVVVIGTTGRRIPASEAWTHVAGVTAGQDISDRQLQFAADPPHFDLGKSRDTYGPVGPVLASPDLLDDPDDLALSCTVNGDVRQQATTAQLILSVPRLIEYLSSILTLLPGDLIFTGTPAGVGVATGTFLADGDVIVTELEGVGTMTNRCVAAPG
jgi:2-keto-4-pentenoate hydratase/2-oxohepta-3-ene-1,7-dioic acid hydratase in catechol pathway